MASDKKRVPAEEKYKISAWPDENSYVYAGAHTLFRQIFELLTSYYENKIIKLRRGERHACLIIFTYYNIMYNVPIKSQ